MNTFLLVVVILLLIRLNYLSRNTNHVLPAPRGKSKPVFDVGFETTLRDLALENSDVAPALSTAILDRLTKVDSYEREYRPSDLANDVAQLVAEHRSAEPAAAAIFIDTLRGHSTPRQIG